MGRRKVDPSKRVRAERACTQCKASKKRCDAALPCSNCIRRGLSASCSFHNSPKRDDSIQISQPLHSDGHVLGRDPASVSSSRLSHVKSSSNALGSLVQEAQFTSRHSDQARSSKKSSSTIHSTRPRLLVNSQGQKVYTGPSGSLSFLQLIRDTVAQSIGASEFSNHPKKDHMLESEHHQLVHIDIFHQVDQQRKSDYAENFLVATRGILGFLSKQDVFTIVQNYRLNTDEPPSYQSSISCLIIAIGAQCSRKDQQSLADERTAFVNAQKMAFIGQLENPTVSLIQNFLLMAFYMLGACKRNAAFMYIGIAARAALAIGLHSNDCYKLVSESKRGPASNLWRSVVTLDLVTSSLLGRAAATTVSRAHLGEVTEGVQYTSDEALTLRSSYKLSLLVDEIVSTLYSHQNDSSTETSKNFLSELNQWRETLPEFLRISTFPDNSRFNTRVRIIGSLHLNCYYHFAVMLVTRPYLISYLVGQLEKTKRETATDDESYDSHDFTATADMAQRCLNSAILTAKTCSDVDEAGFISDNMCILMTWIFGAGLVMGFHMFVMNKANGEVDSAFTATESVLQKLSAGSVQAAHYTEILKHLASAVATQRRLRRSSVRSKGGNESERILDLQLSNGSQTITTPKETLLENTTGYFDHKSWVPETPAQDFNLDFDPGVPFDLEGSMMGWDNFALQFWDQFPYDANEIDANDYFAGTGFDDGVG